MSVVVRCPACREASRVGVRLLGSEVRCPGCDAFYVAVEEAELVAPGPGWVGPLPRRPPDPARRSPLAPPPEPGDEEVEFELTVFDPEAEPRETAREPNNDPHGEPPEGLPASVLIGLALLPFLIPILWLMAAAVAPRQPALTVATPLALAVAASVLCLAVISTIDWTPGTRIKGVLLLVGLSYLTGVGLYFLNRDVVDRVRRFLGIDAATWAEFSPPGAGYSVRVPARPRPVPDQPLGLAPLACHQATQKGVMGPYSLVVGSAKAPGAKANDPVPGADAWFDKAVADVVARCKPAGQLDAPAERVSYRNVFPGRQFVVALGDTGSLRVVRIFVVKNRVYYLAVEGPGLDPGEDLVKNFFESLEIADAAK